jgi:phosphoribosylamine--glycine ligase
MANLKVLVIGSGAREHALAWKLTQSPKIGAVFAAPGNAGTASIGTNLAIKVDDFDHLAKAVEREKIDLVVVGPENPLADGIVDSFRAIQIPIFGPTKAAAQIESSKAFSKALFQKYGIPCAASRTFSDSRQAREYVREQPVPVVVKADGLAAGKGVVIAETEREAQDAVDSIMEAKAFGSAGNQVIIEERLVGREMSYFVVTDGQHILPLAPACDYKRVFDGDSGPNTGGMGSYSPPNFYTEALGQKVLSCIIQPTVEAMAAEKRPYQGVLYAGLMIDAQGEPRLLEYNARLGDPECQVILPRLRSDLLDIIQGSVDGNLNAVRPQWTDDVCVGIVLASAGYPRHYRTGMPISGLDSLDKEVLVFHAGTARSGAFDVVTNGGRVLTLVALGKTTDEARARIYNNLPRIRFEGMQYRSDIAKFH